MKLQHKAILMGLFGGICYWILDSVIDWLAFYEGSFLDLLLLRIPAHEVYMRLLGFVLFLGFGLIVGFFARKREEAEQALQESEASSRNIIESSPLGMLIYELEADGRLIFRGANPAAAKVLGVDKSELIGQEIEQVFPPLAQSELPQIYRQVAAEGQTWQSDEFAYDDGQIKGIFEVHAFQISPGKMVAVFSDVTERKRIQAEISMLAKFPSEDPNPVLRICREGTLLYSNQASAPLLKAWAYQEGQPISEKWRKFVSDALSSRHNQQTECECGQQTFSLTFAPIVDSDYVNVYALDVTARKQAEESLRAKEADEALIIRSVPLVLYSTEAWGEFATTWTSGRVEEITGVDAYRFIEEDDVWASRLHPDDRERAIQSFRRIPETGSCTMEYRWQHANGSWLWFLDQAVLVRDEQGQPKEIIGTWIDISGRKQAEEQIRAANQQLIATEQQLKAGNQQLRASEEELRDSEERFRDFFRNAPVGFHVLGPDRIITNINEAELTMIGYARDELVGKKTWADLIIPEQKDQFEKHWHDIITKGQVRDLEYTLVHKDGHHINVILNSSSRLDKQGNITNTRGSVLDITNRKQAEERLQQVNQQLQTSIDQMPTAYILWDTDFWVLEWNNAAENIFGYTRDEALGCKLDELIVPKSIHHLVAEVLQKLKNGESVSYSEKNNNICKDGTVISCRWHNKPLVDDDGNVFAILSIAEDVTDRRLAEEKIKQQQYYLEKAQELGRMGTWELDLRENKLYWTDENCRIFGVPAGSVVNYEIFIEKVHPDDRKYVKQEWAAALDGKPYDIQHRLIVDDATIWVREKADVEFDEKGAAIRAIGFTQDITDRKHAEQALRQSEERFRTSILESPFPIMIHAEDGEVLQINRIWTELTGYEPDELPTLSAWTELAYGERKDIVKSRIDEIFDCDRRIEEGEYVISSKEGKSLTWDFSSAPLGKMPDGKRLVISMAVDVTDRKGAEAEIVNLARFPSENTSPVLRIDRDGKLLYANTASGELLEDWGCKAGDSVPERWRRLVREALESGSKGIEECELGGRTYSFEIVPLPEAGYANLYARDISDRKQAEQALRKARDELEVRVQQRTVDLAQTVGKLEVEVKDRIRAEKKLQDEQHRLYCVLQMLPGYVILHGPDHKIRFANDRFLDLFGEPGDRPCYDLMLRQDQPCEPCLVLNVLKSQALQEWEWTCVAGRTYHVWGYPFRDIDQTQVMLELGIDITERKNLEMEVLRISESERQRIGQDLHDSLSQTLSGISCLSQVLHTKLAAKSMAEAAEAKRIESLIADSVKLTHSLARGLIPVGVEPEGLMSAVKELALETESMFDTHCTFRCDQLVLIDDKVVATHLYRIAQEAINNAVRHSQAHNVTISLTLSNGDVVLSVEDDGRGLPEESSTNTGMGMGIMNYRARTIGASLNIQPRSEGGTCIVCRLKQTPPTESQE